MVMNLHHFPTRASRYKSEPFREDVQAFISSLKLGSVHPHPSNFHLINSKMVASWIVLNVITKLETNLCSWSFALNHFISLDILLSNNMLKLGFRICTVCALEHDKAGHSSLGLVSYPPS